MIRHVAFLRAINVGGHTVKMERLRSLFETLGFGSVETFIASGNVLFDSPEPDAGGLESRIEEHLQRSLGYPVAAFVRTMEAVREIARYCPFAAHDLAGDTLQYVAFTRPEPGAEAQARLAALVNPVDVLQVHGCEVHWLRRRHLGESAITGSLLEKALRAPATVRNLNTVESIARMGG